MSIILIMILIGRTLIFFFDSTLIFKLKYKILDFWFGSSPNGPGSEIHKA